MLLLRCGCFCKEELAWSGAGLGGLLQQPTGAEGVGGGATAGGLPGGCRAGTHWKV